MNFIREKGLILNCLKLIKGKNLKVDECLKRFLKTDFDDSLMLYMYKTIEVVHKEIYNSKDEIYRNLNTSISSLEKGGITPSTTSNFLHCIRKFRNEIVHDNISKLSDDEINICTRQLIEFLRWYYKKYHNIEVPKNNELSKNLTINEISQFNLSNDRLAAAIPLVEVEEIRISGNAKPTRKSIKEFEKAFLQEIVLIIKTQQWQEQENYFLEVKVKIFGTNGLEGEAVTLKEHFRKLLHKESRLDGGILYRRAKSYLLLGEPGSGKSVLMRQLHKDLLIIKKKEIPPRLMKHIPVYISLRDWDFTQRLEAYIFKYLTEYANDRIESFVKKHFKYLLRKRRFFFLLDGFDEIPAIMGSFEDSELLINISKEVQRFVDRYENRCLIASRKFKAPLEKFFTPDQTFMIQPIKEEIILEAWFRRFDFNTISEIYNSPSLSELMKSPLTIAFIDEYLERKGRQLPNTKAELYEIIIDRRLHDAKLEFENLVPKQEVIECAKCIASYEHDSEIETKSFGLNKPILGLVKKFPARQIQKAIRALNRCKLVKTGEGRVVFTHRSFHDYFYARHVKNKPFNLKEFLRIDNRNALIFYLELCQSKKKLSQIFDLFWSNVENIVKQNITYEDEAFKRGLFSLQMINAGFNSKMDKIEKRQKVLAETIFNLLQGEKNLIVKKMALRCSQLLLPKYREQLVEYIYDDKTIINKPYLSEALIEVTKLMPHASENTQRVIQMQCKMKIEKLTGSIDTYFQLPTRRRPFILPSNNILYYELHAMKLYNTRKKYASNLSLKMWIISFFRIIIMLFYGVFFLLMTYVINNLEDWKWYYGLLFSINFALFFTPILLFIRICLVSSLFYSVFRNSLTIKKDSSSESFHNNLLWIGLLICGLILLPIPTYEYHEELFRRKIEHKFYVYGLGAIFLSLISFSILGSIKDTVLFYHDWKLLRRNRFRKGNSVIIREKLSALFHQFKTVHFRTKFMKRLRKRNIQIEPDSKWPDGKLPNVGDDEASGILAEMEENLLGLSRY